MLFERHGDLMAQPTRSFPNRAILGRVWKTSGALKYCVNNLGGGSLLISYINAYFHKKNLFMLTEDEREGQNLPKQLLRNTSMFTLVLRWRFFSALIVMNSFGLIVICKSIITFCFPIEISSGDNTTPRVHQYIAY